MRKSLIILFLLISTFARATIYYVATDGDDGGAGTIGDPFLTWQKGLDMLTAGDYLYVRGGVYPIPVLNGTGVGRALNGTFSDSIHVFNYPGETPILDCDGVTSTSGDKNYGFVISSGNYLVIKGLTVRNVWQLDSNDEVFAFTVLAHYSKVINCTSYNSHGKGFYIRGIDLHLTNCDSYNHCDSLSASVPGNNGYGFWQYGTTITRSVYYYHCRAWNCGDDGFQSVDPSLSSYDGCWSFTNGALDGEGHGFKLGFVYLSTNPLGRIVKNCLAVYNNSQGYTLNDNGTNAQSMQIYNNISYHNAKSGFILYNTSSSDALELGRIFRNNISYQNLSTISVASGAVYTHSNNSWDIPLTIADANFQDVDSTGLTGARQADGSLPDLGGFLRPSAGSQIIGAGIDVGLTFDADEYLWDDPPSIGAYEYPPVSPTLVTSISVWGTGGATTIEVEGGTLQMIKKTLPVDATDTTCVWSVIDGTGHGTVSSSGLLTAGNNGTVTIRAMANDASGIYGEEEITISNQNPDAALPTVSTKSIGLQTSIWAWSGGDVTDDGGATVTVRGVCWSTSANPTTADSHLTSGTGDGVFDIRIIPLLGNTTYHVRAYATNIEGTGYGTDVEWTTSVDNLVNSGGKMVKSGGKLVIVK